MSTLPLKNPQTLGAVVDELVANFGLRRVFLAVAARLFRKQHPPDSKSFPKLAQQPGVDHLTDHLRRDLGLQPDTHHIVRIDPVMLHRS
jgi:hypothetical protein